jgi:putative sugar O-methyltransferase
MVKIKYFRHPLQTVRTATALFAARRSMWRFAEYGARRFQGDARFDLQNVTNGFQSRIDDSNGDTELLERICEAYIRAVKREPSAPGAYQATEWWQEVRQRSLGPVIRALLTRDIQVLRGRYRNFFRDSCSTGLLGAPYGMSEAYFGGQIRDVYRRFYLSHTLCRLDYWKERTAERFTLRHLSGPGVGNPFGIVVDGTHISVGSEYAHYCAHKIASLLPSEKPTVAEIGGGFGGMAYYLLRDQPGITYLNFDVPESLALASYYLMKSFPKLRFLLYGEERSTETVTQSDVTLMPLFELTKMPPASVDVAFSSHAISDVSPEALVEYIACIDRMTKGCFFYVGKQQTGEVISKITSRNHHSFNLSETGISRWHGHTVPTVGAIRAADATASTMLEQCYVKTVDSGKIR